MPNLTDKQRKFAQGKASGLRNKEAAVFAGYAATSAAKQATNLMQHADVRSEINRLKKEAGKTTGTDATAHPEKDALMKPKYASSLALMRDCYNNPLMPPALRFEAAKQALPYEHAKVGEKGKKENAKEAAERVAGGGKRNKFGPKKPPAYSRAH